MKNISLFFLCLACLILSACITSRSSWTNEEGMAAFDRISSRCERNSERVWDNPGYSKWVAVGVGDVGYVTQRNESARRLYIRCMQSEGFSLKK